MPKKPIRRIRRLSPLGSDERERLKDIREKVRQEFPPLEPRKLRPATSRIGLRLREAREAQGLAWYAVAKLAGIPNPSTVRDIEYGRDTKLSSVQAIANALGLSLELAAASKSPDKRSQRPQYDASESMR